MRKARKTNAVLMINGEVGKPCTNSKFMHIAGIPGMTLKKRRMIPITTKKLLRYTWEKI